MNSPPRHEDNGPLNGIQGSADPWHHELLPEQELPTVYRAAFDAAADHSGSVTAGSLHKTLRGAGLQPLEVDKIMNLCVAGRSRLSLSEFSVALALCAFAQSKQEISIEHVVSMKHSLPTPRLASTAALSTSRPAKPRRISLDGGAGDPWGAPKSPSRQTPVSLNGDALPNSHYAGSDWPQENDEAFGDHLGHADDTSAWRGVSTAELERETEIVEVKMSNLAGRYLNKYTVYEVVNQKHRTTVSRRYSDFAWLHNSLERRYPFRLLASLPPKRIAINGAHAFADEGFLERRRRGLQRYVSWIANHHILKSDGLVHTFFAEAELASWRKGTPVSLVEESSHRRLTPAEEMSIPSDLEAKLSDFRSRLPAMIEHWTKACQTVERIVRRREGQAQDLAKLGEELDAASLADQPDTTAGGYRPVESDPIENDLGHTSEHLTRAATALENRAIAMSNETLERLIAHRALYADFGTLMGRQDRLAPDAVDRLNKRIQNALTRLETVRRERKERWEEAAEKLTGAIEHDQRTVEALLRRRIFIRFAMWEELRFLFRCSRLLQVTLRGWSDSEHSFDSRVATIWQSLANTLGPL